jgi:NADPH:quinone reductase-like Zn-dependent oxidoreductase
MRGFWLAQEVPAMDANKRIKLYGGLAQLIAEGVLVAPIEGRYGLDKLTEAVTRALTPGRSGKVVLTPNG